MRNVRDSIVRQYGEIFRAHLKLNEGQKENEAFWIWEDSLKFGMVCKANIGRWDFHQMNIIGSEVMREMNKIKERQKEVEDITFINLQSPNYER